MKTLTITKTKTGQAQVSASEALFHYETKTIMMNLIHALESSGCQKMEITFTEGEL